MEQPQGSRGVWIFTLSVILLYLLGIAGYYIYRCSCDWGWRECSDAGRFDYGEIALEAVVWPVSLVLGPRTPEPEGEGFEKAGVTRAHENRQWLNIIEMDSILNEISFLETSVSAVFEGLSAANAQDMVQLAGKTARAIEDLEDMKAQISELRLRCKFEKAYAEELKSLIQAYIDLYTLIKTEAPMLRLKENEKPIAVKVEQIATTRASLEKLKASYDKNQCN
jgi:hypothetical protein